MMERGWQSLSSVQGPFTKIKYERLNLNSHDQVKELLFSEGWIPTEYNRVKTPDGEWRTTSPKLTEDSYHTIKGDLGKIIAERNILMHRRRTIQNFEDPENKGILSYVKDGRVPASGILCNTPTGRTTHRGAVCNIPKNKKSVPYGKEIRELFCAREPYRMLGADLKQIESRVTAHYASLFDGGEYWNRLLSVDDIHSYNAEIIGSDRDTAKAFQYALFYGAGAGKLATIIKCSKARAEIILQNFWKENKGIYLLKTSLEEYYNQHGFIIGLDGRKLFIRAKYKLLNSLIQSAAGIIWKKWGCLANERIRECDLYCPQIIAYHDEYQYRCHKDEVPLAKILIQTAALDAGKYFDLNVPIEVDVIEGKNWAETH